MTKRIRDSKALRGLLLGSVAFGLAVPAQANDEIEARLDALQSEIEQLKSERESRPAPANAVTGGDFPGSFKLPGTDTSLAIGGFVRADFIGSLDHDVGDSFFADGIPEAGTPSTGTTSFNARVSRINFDARTPTRLGEARAFLELDLFGSPGNEVISNSFNPRVRHAFGELGPVLAGQTWTLFMPLASYPWTADFHGPQGIPFVRQAQLRYTHDVGNGLTVAGSIENPELWGQSYVGLDIGSRSQGEAGVDRIPDFVGAVQYDQGGWHFKLAGLARLMSVEDVELPDGRLVDDDEFGWGLMGAAVVPVAPTTNFNVNLTYGDGVGRYLLGVFGRQDAFLDEGGSLDAIESWGLATSIMHSWTDQFTSNVVYGRHEVNDTFFAGATETTQSIHVNTFWQPVDRTTFGLEYIHGRRDFDNRDGIDRDNTANRVMATAQFNF